MGKKKASAKKTVRVGTLNVENLFARYNFRKELDPVKSDGFSINDIAFNLYNEDSKKITAELIKLMDADILALQEVEDLQVLDRFNARYLRYMDYKHRILVDGFNARKIDVALLSRYPIVHVRSYRNERNEINTSWLFSRDCLEVDVDVNGSRLRLYINHFKSMIGGRKRTKARRKKQVAKVAEIIKKDWVEFDYKGNYIVLGDFNDYPGVGTSLNKLIKHPFLENVLMRIPKKDRWTHYWAGGDQYSQLDYILISKDLANENPKVKPEVFRQGLPHRASEYEGERIKDVGENHPKASDHAGLIIDLELNS